MLLFSNDDGRPSNIFGIYCDDYSGLKIKS